MFFCVRAYDFNGDEWVGFGASPQEAWDNMLSANLVTEADIDLNNDPEWFQQIENVEIESTIRWTLVEPEEFEEE